MLRITAKGVTTIVGLLVDDVHEVFDRAISAGATEIKPVTDYEYGYRKGLFKDPFGHYWQIQEKYSRTTLFHSIKIGDNEK